MNAFLAIVFGLCLALTGKLVAAESPLAIEKLHLAAFPINTVSPESFLADTKLKSWSEIKNGSGTFVERQTDVYMLVQLPAFEAGEYVLRHWYTSSKHGEENHLDAWIVENNELRPLEEIHGRYTAFALTEADAGRSVLLRFHYERKSPMMLKSLLVLDPLADYEQTQQHDTLMIGFLLGLIGVMVVYNIGLIFFFRRPYMFYYIVGASAGFYWMCTSQGLLGLSSNVLYAFYTSIAVIATCLILFFQTMLNDEAHMPWLYKAGRVEIVALWTALIVSFLGWSPAVVIVDVVLMVAYMTCFAMAAKAVRRGNRPARILIWGYVGLFLASFCVILDNFFTFFSSSTWAVPLAGGLELVSFSFAMGQKLRLSELKFQSENEHAFHQLEKVFYPHQIKMMRKGGHLEDTMPTDSAEAYVIAFDIIASSRLKQNVELFRRVFGRCYELMMENYDGQKMTANAYRIKEMGDGFLCSIGYPFRSLGSNAAADAMTLALSFMRILEEESRILFKDHEVFCAIGIATGTLTGFYPQGDIKEYDLHGSAIIKATRYEAMRKQIFPAESEPGSVLIIQEAVYNNCPEEMQDLFERVELQERRLVVRDDGSARCLYIHSSRPSKKISLSSAS